MKKLTQLITESKVNFEFIEDVMVHYEDMGFTIETFNEFGGYRGRRNYLFGSGSFEDTYHKMNSFSYQPTEVDCYPVYVISFIKKFHPFSDCDLYSKTISIAEGVKKRLSNCQVYFRIDTRSISGASLDSGFYGNTEKNLQVTFHITDKSVKISDKSIRDRESIMGWLDFVVKTYKISNIYSIKWGLDSISIKISTRYGNPDAVKRALVALESQENLDKIVSGYKITNSSETYDLLGTEAIVITYSPK